MTVSKTKNARVAPGGLTPGADREVASKSTRPKHGALERANGSRGAELTASREPGTSYFLPYQVAWIRDEGQLKVCEKGRQIGLSYADSYDSVRKAASAGGRDVWVMSRDEVQAKQYILYCKRWANVLKHAASDFGEQVFTTDSGKAVKVQVLSFASGASIYALSSNPDAIVGKTGHVKLDEFALHKDQRGLYAVAKPVIQWGGTLSIISTHRGVGSVFNSIITDIKERGNRMGWSLHTIAIQRAVDDGIVEKIDAATGGKLTEQYLTQRRQDAKGANIGDACVPTGAGRGNDGDAVESVPTGERTRSLREWWLAKQRAECIDEEQWLQEYCCLPADEASAFISYEMINAAEEDSARKDFGYLEQCKNPLFVGFDVARKVDLAVIDIEERVGDVYWERMRIELHKKTFAEMREELYRVLALPAVRRVCIDSTGLGMQLAEEAVQRWGYRAEAVNFSNQVKQDLAFPLRAAHEDRKIRYTRDEKLQADLRGVKKETTSAGNIRFAGESADSHCDRFWAKALALHAGGKRAEFWSALV